MLTPTPIALRKPLLRQTFHAVGLLILGSLCGCQTAKEAVEPDSAATGPGLGASDGLERQSKGTEARPAKPWQLALGDRVEGSMAVTVGEGSGATLQEAEEYAKANANRNMARVRETQVSAMTEMTSDLHGVTQFTEGISLVSSMTIRGGEWGRREERQLSTGAWEVRIQFKVHQRLIRPAKYLASLEARARLEECENMYSLATSFEKPDTFIAELSVKYMLALEPTLNRVHRLADLRMESGAPEAALRVLQTYRSVVQDPNGELDRRIEEIRNSAKDVPILLARLDLLANDNETLKVAQGRVGSDSRQVVSGLIPANSAVQVWWIDGELLGHMSTTKTNDVFPAARSGDELCWFKWRQPAFQEGKGGDLIPGTVRLLVLTSQGLGDMPPIIDPILLTDAQNGDGVERRRFEAFVDNIRNWKKDPMHQATVVQWKQHR